MTAPFTHDYGAVVRWTREDVDGAVTIEPSGHVVFATFDTNPAVAAGVIHTQASFDEVADGPPRVAPAFWAAAAERLREARRPGRTSCLVIAIGDLGTRCHVRPWDFDLDGAPVSSPLVPGPSYAGVIDERPPLGAGDTFPVAVRPGPHHVAGGVRRFPGGPPEDLGFEADVVVGPGETVRLVIEPGAGRLAIRTVREP